MNNEEEDLPLPRGGYTIDFDNLEGMDPFATKSNVNLNFKPTTSITTLPTKTASPDENQQPPSDAFSQLSMGDTKSATNPMKKIVKKPTAKPSARRIPMKERLAEFRRKNTAANDDETFHDTKAEEGPTSPKQTLQEKIAEMRNKKRDQVKVEQERPSHDELPESEKSLSSYDKLSERAVSNDRCTNDTDNPRPRTPEPAESPVDMEKTIFSTPNATPECNSTVKDPTLDESIFREGEMEGATCDSIKLGVMEEKLVGNPKSSNLNTCEKFGPQLKVILAMVEDVVRIHDASIEVSKALQSREQDIAKASVRESSDRSELEEYYNQIKSRYDRLKDQVSAPSQKNELLNIQRTLADKEEKIVKYMKINQEQNEGFEEATKEKDTQIRNFEQECALLKSKLQISQQRSDSMSQQIAALKEQNSGLEAICEELLQNKETTDQ